MFFLTIGKVRAKTALDHLINNWLYNELVRSLIARRIDEAVYSIYSSAPL